MPFVPISETQRHDFATAFGQAKDTNYLNSESLKLISDNIYILYNIRVAISCCVKSYDLMEYGSVSNLFI